MEADVRLPAPACDKLAGLRFRVAEIAAVAPTRAAVPREREVQNVWRTGTNGRATMQPFNGLKVIQLGHRLCTAALRWVGPGFRCAPSGVTPTGGNWYGLQESAPLPSLSLPAAIWGGSLHRRFNIESGTNHIFHQAYLFTEPFKVVPR
jgi:hypothetical protein